MAWVSPKTEADSEKLKRHLFAGIKWWKRRGIDTALGYAILEAGRNHATSVQPLTSPSGEVIYGITLCNSDTLYIISPDNPPAIEPSPRYSEKLPLLLRIALTYADELVKDFDGPIEEPELPSVAYERLLKGE